VRGNEVKAHWTFDRTKYVNTIAYMTGSSFSGGATYQYRDGGLRVIITPEYIDGKRWVHVSCWTPQGIPNLFDIAMVKREFIGQGRRAIIIAPDCDLDEIKKGDSVHLWHCTEGDGLPDLAAEED